MAIGLAALGLLAFLLGCPGTFAEPQNSEPAAKCVLTGNWRNDLKFTMEIDNVNETGVFSGVYKTPFWGYIRPHPPANPLVGIQHQGRQPVFGFTVSWKVHGYTSSPEYTLVFVGQCLVDEDGEEQLKTIRLLREEVESAAEDWGATSVGTETFYRTSSL